MLTDQMILVTGGGRGIGLHLCRHLAAKAAAVISASIEHTEDSRGLALLKSGQVANVHLDVRDELSVERLFSSLDRLQVTPSALVNCAGIGVFKSLEDTSYSEWNNVWQTNVTGVFLCCREAIKRMRRRGFGRILNIGSIAGLQALPNNSAYGASKAAVNMLGAAINLEYAQQGVLATTLNLGAVYTEIWNARPEFSPGDMLSTNEVSDVIEHILSLPLNTRVDEVKMLPPKGVL